MKKFAIGCLGVVAVVAAILAGLFIFWMFHELPVLDAKLDAPSETLLGSTVTMVVEASNSQDKAITLDSIDIDNTFLAGFQVLAVEPEPQDTTHVPILDQRSWEFGKELAPGEAMKVTFTLKPVSEGRFQGDVDVCNPNQDFRTLLVDIVVKGSAGNANDQQ